MFERYSFVSVLLAISCVWYHNAPAQQFVSATLVEAHLYEPCDSNCMFNNHHTTEYCFHVGDRSLVGHSAGFWWLNENWSTTDAIRKAIGKPISIRFDSKSIAIKGMTRKIKTGTEFEHFRDSGCIAEVHKPKLALAASSPRPANVPNDTFPVAGSHRGNSDIWDRFDWVKCSAPSNSDSIACTYWSPKGEGPFVEHFCAKTVAGKPIRSDFQIDRILSTEEKIVLSSGGDLMPDGRGRTNDVLQLPEQPCHGQYNNDPY